MSDGCKDNDQQEENTNNVNCSTRNVIANNDFVEAIAKNAVAQICDYEGFQGFHNSVVDAFADVAVKYVMEVGKTSNLFANRSGRSQCNVFDVILGLESLASIQGFLGASNLVNPSLPNSAIVRDISQYVNLVEANPFLFTLPSFPVSKSRKPPSTFLDAGVLPPSHIPPWLPAFPLPDSEITKQVVEQVPKTGQVGMVNVQQQHYPHQQAQQHQLGANNGADAVEINPFLATPFAFGEQQVSVIEPFSRIWEGNHVHSMDMYAPVEEPARNEEVTVVQNMSKDVKSDERRSVRFKFRDTRKSLRVFKNVIAQMNGQDEMVPVLVERNDENDEKKRRAEQILKESMETPLDTTEL